MATQPGDHLASGAPSATFHMAADKPARSKRKILTIKERKKPFYPCKDCNFKAYSAAEFSDHVGVCPVRPIHRHPCAAKNLAEVKARSGKQNMRIPEEQ